jgi:hypothetical protein
MAFIQKLNSLLIVMVLGLTGFNFTPVAGQIVDGPDPVIRYAGRNDLSQPLSLMADLSPGNDLQAGGQVFPVQPIPRSSQSDSQAGDEALQLNVEFPNMPAATVNFDGVSNRNGVLPPDTQGDIGYDPATGKKYYIQWVNLSYQIWDVTNSTAIVSVLGPANGSTLWNGFGGACETTNDGDPITLFDPLAKRWLMSQFALPYGVYSGPYYQCIAISQSADPTGAWYRYEFEVHATKMNDYPKFGVWPDAYYMTVNQFQNGSWAGAGVYAFERERMLAGLPAAMVYFDLASVNINVGGMLPADLDGNIPPPDGTPGLFAEVDDANWVGPADAIRLWEFDVNWSNPLSSTFGNQSGGDIANANVYLPVSAFTPIPCDYCIPQQGTTVKLDSLADRAMYRLAYRNFGDHQTMVFNHTVKADGVDRAGIRWYELGNYGSGWTVSQQSTYAPSDGLYRWMGSIAMDGAGNMALGYSLSGTALYPSIAATGRLSGDPADQMTQGETMLMSGSGYQSSSSSRWGDYSMMGIDPQDDCTFWYTNEYLASSSTSGWKTRISAFRFVNCGITEAGMIQGVITDSSSGALLANAGVSSNGTETVSDSNGEYSLTLPAGTYDLTAAKYGYESQTITNLIVNSGETTTQDFALSAFPQSLVHGQVYEGGVHGWPLYTRITFSTDQFETTIFSDPFDGSYAINLVQGVTYQVSAEAVSSGYLLNNFSFLPSSADETRDIIMLIDGTSCQAAGYQLQGGLVQNFDSAQLPSGWQIIDETGSGAIWEFSSVYDNNTGGSGNFAIADSDKFGTVNMTTSLISPSVNLSSTASVALQFKYDYYDYSADFESANVDISIGGGAWTNVWQRSGDDDRGPKTATLDITSLAAGQEDVRVRFRYADASFSWYWQVDDVVLGESVVCDPIPGGLVAGTVTEASSGLGMVGVNIDNSAGRSTTSFAENGDAAYDGIYFLFQPLNSGTTEPFTYRSSGVPGYPDYESQVNVAPDVITRQDFVLGAAKIAADPTSFSLSLPSNSIHQEIISISNSGLASTDVTLFGLTADLSSVSGSIESPNAVVKPFKQIFPDAESLNLGEELSYPVLDDAVLVQHWASELKKVWAVIPSQPDGAVWVSSPGDGWGGSNAMFSYDGNGNALPNRINYGWQPNYGPADIAWDPTGEIAWTVNVDREADFCFKALDLSGGYSGKQVCPAGLAGSQRGLAYDPLSDSFFSGSWNDGMLYRFDRLGNMLDAKWIQHAISGLAYHPGSKHLYVMLNAAPTKLVVLDTKAGFMPIGEIALSGWMADYGGAGIEFSPDGSLWLVDQKTGIIYQFDVGEEPYQNLLDTLSWLSLSPDTFSLSEGTSQDVQLNFDTSGLSAGYYEGRISISDTTPYLLPDVIVHLIIDENLLPHIFIPIVSR